MAQRTVSLPQTQTADRAPATVGWLTPRRRGMIIRQIFLQLFLLTILAIVLFPVLWIISMAIDPRGVTRPTDLVLIPQNANLDAFARLLTQPFSNVLPMYFGEMLMNSLFIALGTSVFTVVLGSSAAYAFSRFRFIGRQGGMLGFIVLLLLPTTGTIIPLYVLFSSIQMNNLIVVMPPAFFGSGLIVILIWLVYNSVRVMAKHDSERWFNPGPVGVTIGAIALTLIAIFAAVFIMYERSPLYAQTVKVPIGALAAEEASARQEFNRFVNSVSQRTRTAERQEAAAARAAEDAARLAALETTLASIPGIDGLATALRAEIAANEDTRLAQPLTDALTALESGGVAAAREALTTGVTTLTDSAQSSAESAARARANADEAAADLIVSQARLETAVAANADEASAIFASRNQVYLGVVPLMLGAFAASLAAAGVIWGIVYALRNVFEPRAIINILAWAVLTTLFVWIGWSTLQSRLGALDPLGTQPLRATLLGLSFAFASGALPFAIWNLKGYFDTIPKDLEEAALIDGAGLFGTFIRVMIPLALPAFAIVILFSFMNGWTEFILSWIFLTGRTDSYTLAMALATMANGGNAAPPDMQKFAAMSILISVPIMALFFAFQRWIVGGLAIGGVKG